MQLFVRAISLSGSFADVAGYSSDMRSYVSDKIGIDVALWSALFGAPLGSMGYTAHIEGLAHLQSIGASLTADPGYHERLAKGQALVAGPAEDQLYTPIHGELGDHPPVGSVATITTAAIANGQYAEAIAWGVDMSQHVESVIGSPVLFCLNEFGAFGQVTWIGVAADAAAADASAAAIAADAQYLDKVSSGASLFVPGSGHRSLMARIA